MAIGTLGLMPTRTVIKNGEPEPVVWYDGYTEGVYVLSKDGKDVYGSVFCASGWPTQKNADADTKRLIVVIDTCEVPGSTVYYTWPDKSIALPIAYSFIASRIPLLEAKYPKADVSVQSHFMTKPFNLKNYLA